MMKLSKPYLIRVHYLVFCSECGRISAHANLQTAESQRNWHELRHLEGVQGKQTVVKVQVVTE